jgi:thymidylate kinase
LVWIAVRRGERRRVIIGVCGIDGAGKSTLISRLLSLPGLAHAAVRKMPPGENYRRLLRLHPGLWEDPSALVRTSRGHAVGWAEVLDFLSYQEREIRPSLTVPGVLIHDRWTPCFTAFCDSVLGLGGRAALRLRQATPADLILYLDVSPEAALDRIRQTRQPLPDEDITVLRAFHAGYEDALREQGGTVVRIGELDPDAVAKIAEESVEQTLGDVLDDMLRHQVDRTP